jgi:uncharacterized repeat protein (TIGR01451 family)
MAMRLGPGTVESRRFARRGRPAAGWAAALLAVLGLLFTPTLEAQGTPAGTQIRNWATLAFDAGGQSYVVTSDTVVFQVRQVAGVSLQPPRFSLGAAGAAVVFAHTLTNLGNGPDSFAVTAVSVHGWPVTLYRDWNGDGLLGTDDSLLTGPVPLASGSAASLLARVAIPGAASPGVSDTITVTATSRFSPAVSSSVQDRLDVSSATVAVSLTKLVDRPTAAAADILTYTVDYAVSGSAVASAVRLADSIPPGTSYVPGTMRWNGAPLTDAPGDDAGFIAPAGNGVVVVDFGTLTPGATGSVTFQVQVNPGPARTVDNRSNVTFNSAGASDTALSNTVHTNVLVPALSLSKQLTSPSVALVGQQVHYTLRYGNAAGAAPAQSVVLTDTLPTGLLYFSATSSPAVAGQVLTWSLGTLAAGDSGAIDVVAVVAATVRDTVLARNLAYLQAQGTAAQSAAAAQLALVGPPTAALGLDLTADVLEVGVGEAIPYTIVVRNPGTLTVTSMRITVRLPVGARYVPRSAIGADSSAGGGGQLILFTGAALVPAASRTLRFVAALVSAPGSVAEARATASGQVSGGLAGSPEAIAWVQVRRAWPMETRAAIGKVSVQGAGEIGLANIDIWTEDGQVATTDSTGKFSFTNLRPGRHAFRVDPRSIPEGYQVAGEEVQLVDASGWTTPRVSFHLIASGAAPAARIPQPPARSPVRDTVPPEAMRRPVQVAFAAIPLPAPPASDGSLPELPLSQGGGGRPKVRYEVTLRQPQDDPLDAVMSFSPLADSAVVYRDGVRFTSYSWLNNDAIPVPPARPGAEIRIVAWSSERRDSATLRIVTWPSARAVSDMIRRLAGRTTSSVRAAVHNPRLPVVVAVGVPTAGRALPAPDTAVAVVPAAAGAVPAPDTAAAADPSGHGAPAALAETVLVAPARSPGDRATERQAALVRGPGVEILAPQDGAVLTEDRVYIGVKGEPNAPLVLYDGGNLIDTVHARIDGVYDFIAVPLARGPHRLRVAMRNSWGQERWDSIAVHETGLPARFEVPSRVTLVADGRSTAVVDVRVLDRWGVPVAQPAYVSVNTKGAEPQGADADPSSVGLQLLSSATGRLRIALRPGRDVGPGALELKSGDATDTVRLELLPEVRGLTVAGSGMVGTGASPESYGAVTARGRLDSQTSFTLGLDSRRLRDGQDAFGRSADPLAQSQYPILGDASVQQTRTASRTWLSARVERGFDWAAFGDLSSADFTSGLSLAQYRRSVTGLAARVTTGPLTWNAFGSLTSQSLRQLQIRGAGISGPYQVAGGILPGTESLRLETRDLQNPERAIATLALTRFVDYQIDYVDGVVLFKQPIPAADANGNPVFVVATFEAAAAGEARLVAGARAALDMRPIAEGLRLDSLRIGVTAVSAEQTIDRYRLVGGDVRAFRFGAVDVGAEVAYAEHGDSAGLATSVKASYGLFGGAVTVAGGYMRIGRQFTNPSNVALQPGLTEESLRGGLRVAGTELRAEHTRQNFELQGIDREHTRVGIVQTVTPAFRVDAGVANDQLGGGALTSSEVTAAEVKTHWDASPALQFWTEARRRLSISGPELSPEAWGFGGSYRVARAIALEASHRYVARPDSQGSYSVSSFGVRADLGPGTQAWGSYQLSGGVSGAGNAAIVGLRNRLQLSSDLTVNLLFERRQGVRSASIADPVRALPFLQTEGDYWSAGAGLELLPQHAPYRLTARAEVKDGALQSTRLATLAGDVTFDASLALLSRQEFAQNALPGAPLSRRLTSLWGLALRPVHSDRVNMLAKLEWTDDQNPIGGGVLVPQGKEQRLIGAAEVIWAPLPSLELASRYAMRRTQADRRYPDGTPQTLTAWADYIGGRMTLALAPWLSVRSDGRLLVERTTGSTAWDGSPALVLHPVNGLEIATGYRFGTLDDPDFSVRGGHGLFVTLSAALTEKVFPTAAAFWRSRF